MGGCVVADSEILGERVASIPSALLQVPALGVELYLLDGQRDVALVTDLLHKGLIR